MLGFDFHHIDESKRYDGAVDHAWFYQRPSPQSHDGGSLDYCIQPDNWSTSKGMYARMISSAHYTKLHFIVGGFFTAIG